MAFGGGWREFEELLPGEALRVVDGRRRQLQEGFELRRVANYELAHLIAVAVHRPKSLPAYRRMDERGSVREIRKATEADHDVIRAYFMRLAGKGAARGR